MEKIMKKEWKSIAFIFIILLLIFGSSLVFAYQDENSNVGKNNIIENSVLYPDENSAIIYNQAYPGVISADNVSEPQKFVQGEVIIKLKKDAEIKEKNFLKKNSDYVINGFSDKELSNFESNKQSVNVILKKYQVKKLKRVFENSIKIGATGNAVLSESEENLNNIFVLEVNNTPDSIEDFQNDPNIEYAEPNYLYELYFYPNDPRYNEQWAHQITKAGAGWDISRGSHNVSIAILDTGVDWQHEDLSANIWTNKKEIPNNGIDDDHNGYIDDIRGWDFTDTTRKDYCTNDCTVEDNDPMDEYGHGTHCAGIAAGVGNNLKGIIGVCPNCTIMALRVAGLSDIEISRGIHYAADNGAKAISMSFGGGSYSQTQRDAINYAYSKNVTLIAAAGNSNTNALSYPAAYDNVIAVTATNQLDKKASFSNYGTWTDIAAPGQNILSTLPKIGGLSNPDGYGILSGTSMATPYVAGLAGLI